MDREKSAPFYALLEKVKELHDNKGRGYEAPGDRALYPNYRRMDRWAKSVAARPEQSPAIYALMRNEEKLERIRAILEGAEPHDEAIPETLLDMAVISLIALILYQEREAQ